MRIAFFFKPIILSLKSNATSAPMLAEAELVHRVVALEELREL